jgi:hypothetical protein
MGVPRKGARLVLVLACGAWLAGCGTTKKSRAPEGDAQAQEASGLLLGSERLIRALDVAAAQKKLDAVRVLLKDPRIQTHPDQPELWDRFNNDQGDLELAKQERIKRDLQIKVNAQEQTLERARGPLLKALEDLDKPDIVAAQVDAVHAASKKVQEALVPGKPLEAQDPGYAEEAKHAARLMEKAAAAETLAQKRLAFISGPLVTVDSGLQLAAQAKAEKDKTKRQPLAQDAKAKLEACAEAVPKALLDSPDLAGVSVLVDGKPKKIEMLTAACRSELKSTDKLLALLARSARKHSKK